MATKLYTLFATPDQTADFVMVASLRTIEQYLGAQVPRTFAAGESAFTLDPERIGKAGNWLVAEGAVGYPVSHTQASYLDRFPAEARIFCNEAYQNGYDDRASEEPET